MAKCALILVDIQNDFLHGGALAVPDADAVIPVANRVQKLFALIVATQDWHPPEHGSFAVNHPGAEVGEVRQVAGLAQVMWPAHCVQETPGAAFPRELNQPRIARVFRKGTDPQLDSFSGFFDNGYRRSTGLTEFLSAEQVQEVYVMGLATDYCVKSTALDARRLGFITWLVEDGCRGVELHPGDTARAIEEMCAAGVRIVRSDAIEVAKG